MYYKSKKVSLSILFLTAIVCSLAAVSLFADQEYKNLLAVVFMTLGIFIVSVLVYFINPSRISFDNPVHGSDDPNGLATAVQMAGQLSVVNLTGLKRIFFVVALQIVVAAAIFLYWN